MKIGDEQKSKNKSEDLSGGSVKDGEIAARRVVRELCGPANWPLLTKTNYTEWSLIMKIKMQARNLWDAIETGDVTLQEDRMTLDAITSAVPKEMVASLAVKATAAEAWEAVKSLQVGSEQVRKSQGQRLRREFETIRFNDGELIDDFTMRLSNLVAALGTVGETIEANKVVEKLLRVVPKRFSQVAVAIEVTADLSKLTLEEVASRLRAAEDRMTEDDQASANKKEGKLLLTEEEWAARKKGRRQEGSAGGSKSGKGRKHGPRNETPSNGYGERGNSSAGREVKRDECRRCGKTGHWAT